MAFLFACSVDEVIKPDQVTVSDGLKSGHSNGTVVKVLPNGTDDTQAFIDAFEKAKTEGPGSVVQLVEGIYNIGFTEIRDFKGSFIGAGKAKTKIQNIDKLPSVASFYESNQFPVLLSFIGGEVNISKMTFATKDGLLCPDDVYVILQSILGLSDFSAEYVPSKRFIRAVVEDVDFICGFDYSNSSIYGTDFNVNMTVYVGAKTWVNTVNDPFSSVEITFKRCLFDHGAVAFDTWGLDETSLVIFENNTVKNGFYSLIMCGNLGLKAFILNNRFMEAPMGIFIDDSDWGIMPCNQSLKKRSEFNIFGNNCQSKEGSTSIYIKDSRRVLYPDEGLPQLFNIKNNTFNLSDGSSAISGVNIVGSFISNNKFNGTGNVGILLDGEAATNTFAENDRIFGNNFSAANYTEANVILGEFTKNCKVIGGGNNNGSVIDLGVNNFVSSFKMKQKGGHWNYHPPKMKQKLNMRHLHR
jgi:hypothetical protein